MVDRPSQNIGFQIRSKETKEFETQFGISEIFPLFSMSTEIRKAFRQVEPTVGSKSLRDSLGKANGVGLASSADETHFSDSKDVVNPRAITFPSQMLDEQPEWRRRQIPD